MSTDSPPRSSRPRAGGEFTWPPTSEELDSIEVIPLDGSPSVTTAPATPAAPATLVVPTAAAVAASMTTTTTKKIETPVVARRQRLPLARLPHARLALPRGEDLAYIGVTFASALAIAVAAMLQLSDSRLASETAAAPRATAPAEAAASPVANVALLQLLEKEGADDAARKGTDAPSVSPATPSARTASDGARRQSHVAARTPPTPTRRAVYARRSAPNLTARERRDRDNDRSGGRSRDRDRGSLVETTAAAAMPIASPPLRLPESYVQPRVVSQRPGRHRGQVVLAVQVRSNGRVGDIEVLSKDDDRGYDDLERAAVSAVKRWRYRPALRDGVPTPARVKVVVNFS